MYYDNTISFEALYKGLNASCRSVRWKDSVTRYEANNLVNTYRLRQSILNNTYNIDKYQYFVIYEPKRRGIYAPRIKDRQLQHALCDSGLYTDITEHFIRDNGACQRRRGTDDALTRMKIHLQKYARNYGNSGWYLKCDIHHFFPNINHTIAKQIAAKYISDQEVCRKVCDVIDSFNGNKGLGLGSQISQILAILILNDLDHYIKEHLHIKHYIRYMDDFILIHPSKQYLQYCFSQIKLQLMKLELDLNKKSELQPVKHGIYFLKWKYLISPTTKILMLKKPKCLKREKQRLKKIWVLESSGCRKQGATAESCIAFIANLKRGNTYYLQLTMYSFYKNLTGSELK